MRMEHNAYSDERADMLQRLPPHALSLRDVLRFGLLGCARDFFWLTITGVLGGLLALAMPLSIGFLVDDILPNAQTDLLSQLALFILTAVLTISALGFVRALAFIRISTRASHALQSALMERLLHLPTNFFRQYAAADLAQRLLGIARLMRAVTAAIQTALLGWLFGLFSYTLLFWISLPLALLASVLVFVAFTFCTVLNIWRLRQARQISQLEGSMANRVFQLLNGINKIRTAGAEQRVFALWASDFAQQKQWHFHTRRIGNILTVFDAAYGVLCLLLLFGAVKIYTPALSTGSFLIFHAAFLQFFVSSLAMAHAISNVAAMIPLYERARPILQALPEQCGAQTDPGELSGAIEISHLRFRYHVDGPLILDDVSISILPGQFIAIVGPSGAGKSTLLRCLLGFDQALSGAVYYDDQNLAGLDVLAVRRQMGVVLQRGKLMPGTIFSNIIGAAKLSLDDAWEAARMAGLESDIAAMPMGMHSVVTDNGGTLSGGQKQRLLIARAIARKPRIVLLDEATSALDNQTQSIVAHSIAQLSATRIVIAHRLSTVIQVDQIFYLESGKLIESGSYAELMAQDGAFAALAKRQLS